MRTRIDRCEICGIVLDEDTIGSRPGVCVVCESLEEEDDAACWDIDDELLWDDDEEDWDV